MGFGIGNWFKPPPPPPPPPPPKVPPQPPAASAQTNPDRNPNSQPTENATVRNFFSDTFEFSNPNSGPGSSFNVGTALTSNSGQFGNGTFGGQGSISTLQAQVGGQGSIQTNGLNVSGQGSVD